MSKPRFGVGRTTAIIASLAVLGAADNMAGGPGCQACKKEIIWLCKLVLEDGGETCVTTANGCTVAGNCTYVPPPPPPPPPPVAEIWQSQHGLFELQPDEPCFPFCENFPASVPLAEAYDFPSTKTKIAELSGLPESVIAVKGRGYLASWAPSFDPGTFGWIVDGNDGYMFRRDVDSETGSLRVRVCRFSVGGPAEIVSDQTLTDAGTLLVRLPLGEHDVVLSFREERIAWAEFAANHVTYQQTWASDYDENLSAPAVPISIGTASTRCGGD